jgi:hypothetical protein
VGIDGFNTSVDGGNCSNTAVGPDKRADGLCVLIATHGRIEGEAT